MMYDTNEVRSTSSLLCDLDPLYGALADLLGLQLLDHLLQLGLHLRVDPLVVPHCYVACLYGLHKVYFELLFNPSNPFLQRDTEE